MSIYDSFEWQCSNLVSCKVLDVPTPNQGPPWRSHSNDHQEKSSYYGTSRLLSCLKLWLSAEPSRDTVTGSPASPPLPKTRTCCCPVRATSLWLSGNLLTLVVARTTAMVLPVVLFVGTLILSVTSSSPVMVPLPCLHRGTLNFVYGTLELERLPADSLDTTRTFWVLPFPPTTDKSSLVRLLKGTSGFSI